MSDGVEAARDTPEAAPGLPGSALADIVLERLAALYPTSADPARARSAAAYMKHVAPFLGIPTPRRRALSRTVLEGTARPGEADCAAIALRCWALPEREYQYFAADPELRKDMDAWIEDDDLWIVRTALLHQLRFKEAADSGRLFGYCLRRAGHPDFFIRKAIGWCLREYAKTDPQAVRGFVDGARGRLSPLSVREATKHL
ncbi:DNA alkylation repair protein [Streptomyces laculatispora]|uniref:DNA alkylation repair protein n=1 Tax=Streptomyces laculatispora TaxID=887464 RepID=A0ABY9IDY9_9ACTN|nr:DNA alkylation repair protein [Streptomyces laculatispora]WLQ44459.1 DNA alkylation repair protein [Streptomyces laculatispora]